MTLSRQQIVLVLTTLKKLITKKNKPKIFKYTQKCMCLSLETDKCTSSYSVCVSLAPTVLEMNPVVSKTKADPGEGSMTHGPSMGDTVCTKLTSFIQNTVLVSHNNWQIINKLDFCCTYLISKNTQLSPGPLLWARGLDTLYPQVPLSMPLDESKLQLQQASVKQNAYFQVPVTEAWYSCNLVTKMV